MSYKAFLPAVFVLFCLFPVTARAGVIFLPGKLDDGKFVANREVNGPFYSIQYSTVTAAVDDWGAHVKIEETIVGPEQGIDTVLLIPLPAGADDYASLASPQPTSTALLIPLPVGGNDSEAVVRAGPASHKRRPLSARFLTPAAAQGIYETLAGELDNVKILALSGRPALIVPAFHLQGKVEITIEFWQKVRQQGGLCRLECPLPAAGFARGSVARLSANVTITGKEPLRAIFCPTHTTTVDRNDLHKAVVRVKADNYAGTDDLRLLWVADKDDLGLRVLACKPDAEEDGYFLLVGNPTGSARAEPAAEKNVTFVLDTSGSMRGEKIEQARSAIDYCLGQINAGDRFNIVTFGTEVTGFREAPVAGSPANVAAAREFIDNVVAKGETNISGALAKALGGEKTGRPPIVIFLTDGTPTVGERVPERIVEQAKLANTSGARIFVMGLGHDVNAHLLDKLAEATGGSSEYIVPGEEIDAKVASLYDRLAHPVLTDVEVTFGQLRTNSVYPQKLPALFRGSEVMVFGRYRDGGKQTFTVAGKLGDKPVEYTCTADLPEKPTTKSAETDNDFVAPLWAARKIGFLLQEIRLHGANDERIGEVVRLSKRFGIVTEYTTFLATAAGDLSAGAALGMARRQMEAAAEQKAGKWAVNQARNDQQLQQRGVAGAQANTYFDRRGNVVTAENIRQVGRRVFYLRDGQWVDGEDAGKRKTRVVKLDGPEYRDLVRKNRDFAQSQQLGWSVQMNVGDERIVVEKNGQQKDEQLRRQAPQEQVEESQEQMPMNQRQQFRNQAPRKFNQLQQEPQQ